MTISLRQYAVLTLALVALVALASGPARAQQASGIESFPVRFHHPKTPNGETIVLLHGSGGNETSLMEMAAQAAPNALLIGVGGRVTQDGTRRWYRRITPVAFDQTDIRKEASAFAAFLRTLSKTYKLDPQHTTLLGYSNGANLIAAMALLHPEAVKRAILMRPMPVLEQTPAANLAKASFLTIAGLSDKIYAPFAPALEGLLERNGASVDARTIDADHMLGAEDVAIVANWLTAGRGLSPGLN